MDEIWAVIESLKISASIERKNFINKLIAKNVRKLFRVEKNFLILTSKFFNNFLFNE